MTVGIHRGDGNGRSPFQVSVGVVRLRRLVVDGTRGLTSLSLYIYILLCYWLKFQADCLRRVLVEPYYGAVVARPGLSKMGDVSLNSPS